MLEHCRVKETAQSQMALKGQLATQHPQRSVTKLIWTLHLTARLTVQEFEQQHKGTRRALLTQANGILFLQGPTRCLLEVCKLDLSALLFCTSQQVAASNRGGRTQTFFASSSTNLSNALLKPSKLVTVTVSCESKFYSMCYVKIQMLICTGAEPI